MEAVAMSLLAVLIIVGSLFILFKFMKAVAFHDAKKLKEKWREYEREERRKQSPWQ